VRLAHAMYSLQKQVNRLTGMTTGGQCLAAPGREGRGIPYA
jgi:hypothetical protein